MSFRPIYAKRSQLLLTQVYSINQLVAHATHLNQLQSCLNIYLSATMEENCAIASFKQGVLTLLTPQANWATRLRYQQNQLIKQLKEHNEFKKINKIITKVSPSFHQKTKETHSLLMSSNTAKVINETAENIQHPKLKEALKRLASHAK